MQMELLVAFGAGLSLLAVVAAAWSATPARSEAATRRK